MQLSFFKHSAGRLRESQKKAGRQKKAGGRAGQDLAGPALAGHGGLWRGDTLMGNNTRQHLRQAAHLNYRPCRQELATQQRLDGDWILQSITM